MLSFPSTNDIPYLSDRWMDMLKFTQAIGKENKVEIDMTTGTGWPFGGPWVPLEESASKSVFIVKAISEKKIKNMDLSPAEKDADRCKLLKVMAYDTKGNVVDLSYGITVNGNKYLLNAKLPQKDNWKIHYIV